MFQVAAWLTVAAIGVLSLVAPSLRPVTVLPHNLEHAAIFALAGFAAGVAYPARPLRLLAMLVIFAGAIELAQFYAPGRHPSRIDFVVDAFAGCAGAAIALVLMKLRGRAARS
jgi:VanZ family protein